MTKEEKMNWITNANNEELLKQYLTSSQYSDENPFDMQYREDVRLCKDEILRRMSK